MACSSRCFYEPSLLEMSQVRRQGGWIREPLRPAYCAIPENKVKHRAHIVPGAATLNTCSLFQPLPKQLDSSYLAKSATCSFIHLPTFGSRAVEAVRSVWSHCTPIFCCPGRSNLILRGTSTAERQGESDMLAWLIRLCGKNNKMHVFSPQRDRHFCSPFFAWTLNSERQ